MLSPDHAFDLLKIALAAVLGALVSLWGLRRQRRQNEPRLEVVLSPIFLATLDGKSVPADDWPGILVRNQSPFPLRICNIGFRVGDKLFEFGIPLGADLRETAWPYEIAPRTRTAFYFNADADYGRRLASSVWPELKGRLLWQTVRGYAITECAKTFTSPRLCRKTKKMLRVAVKERSIAFPLAPPNQIIEQSQKSAL
jgi:hypothetical protein